ncbi:MAG: ABC transporter ATP-binding protein [Peptoniphilaceae bacterium]|nr:ABC transporter ATP-binding protein [Peptoniphilaceae bacterium]MDD7383715.1 ABC transporter ATP-binding protein [Peptoniphilaceae bacterium]MDY3737886.1 ABC transporter ATP-binding protein [Peptoniphilaceae bacterium]
MITVKNLKKVYDNKYEALKNVNLEIEDGELVCLLGPSGCGKSTMLNIIAGLLDPTDGEIFFDEKNIINLHPKDRNIGMVFQNYSLYPHMNVIDNVIFPLRVGKNKMKREDAIKKVQIFMEMTDIKDIEDKFPSSLSGGQQQRVAIARALVQNPKILLLDEPLSNLDARLRLRIREQIRILIKKIGVTSIFVTHDQEEAMSIADRIAIMDNGIVQQYDKPQNLYKNPSNLFVAKFLGTPEINIYSVKRVADKLLSRDISFDLSVLKKHEVLKMSLEKNFIIGIRPEFFEISDDGEISAIVSSVEMLGRFSVVHFELNDISSRLIAPNNIDIKSGDKINLKIAYENIYIFSEDGRRLY